jgi:hypothetical protein
MKSANGPDAFPKVFLLRAFGRQKAKPPDAAGFTIPDATAELDKLRRIPKRYLLEALR